MGSSSRGTSPDATPWDEMDQGPSGYQEDTTESASRQDAKNRNTGPLVSRRRGGSSVLAVEPGPRMLHGDSGTGSYRRRCSPPAPAGSSRRDRMPEVDRIALP